jgi:hypothetical protein
MFPFLAQGVHQTGEPNLDEDEQIELVSFSKDQVVSLLQQGELVDGKSIVALTLAGFFGVQESGE